MGEKMALQRKLLEERVLQRDLEFRVPRLLVTRFLEGTDYLRNR